MDPSPAGGGRGRRRNGGGGGRASNGAAGTEGRGGRRRKKRRSGGGGGRNNRGGHSHSQTPDPIGDSSSVLGSRVPQKVQRNEQEGPPDAFSLFASYYFGVTIDDTYQKPSLESTARRYGVGPADVRELLRHYNLEKSAIAELSREIEEAKLDIRLAPEGISRTEIARDFFEENFADRKDIAPPDMMRDPVNAKERTEAKRVDDPQPTGNALPVTGADQADQQGKVEAAVIGVETASETKVSSAASEPPGALAVDGAEVKSPAGKAVKAKATARKKNGVAQKKAKTAKSRSAAAADPVADESLAVTKIADSHVSAGHSEEEVVGSD